MYGFGNSPGFATPSFLTLLNGSFILDVNDGDVLGDGPYVKSPGLNSNDGTVYVVAGHGGNTLGGSGLHPVMFFREAAHGSCLLDIDGSTLTLTNVRSDGVFTDSFSIVKLSATVPPDAPTNLTAIDVVGAPWIDLSWADNAIDEAGFEIEDSRDGGVTFSLLITLGVNVTGYQDVGLTPGTESCYQVRAVNAADASAYSNIACACAAAADDATCDGVDDDCDGSIDEDYVTTPTNCGTGACSSTGQRECQSGSEFDTCTPAPAAPNDATCDGVDDDCDDEVDEDYSPTGTACGTGACASTGQIECQSGSEVDTCTAATAAANDATCDGVDDNCDGVVDEGYSATGTTCGTGACASTGQIECQSGSEVDT